MAHLCDTRVVWPAQYHRSGRPGKAVALLCDTRVVRPAQYHRSERPGKAVALLCHTRVVRPAQYGSRSSRLTSLPAVSRGKSAWNDTSRGVL